MALRLSRRYRPSAWGIGVVQVTGDGGQILTMDSFTEVTEVASGVAVQETAIAWPANSVVLGVTTKVLTQPGGTTTMGVQAAVSGHQFNTDDVSTVADSGDPGTAGCPTFQSQASPVQYVFDAATTDALGRIRTTLFYYTVTP